MRLAPELRKALDIAAALKATRIFNDKRRKVNTSDFDKGVEGFQRTLGFSRKKARAAMSYSVDKANEYLDKLWEVADEVDQCQDR